MNDKSLTYSPGDWIVHSGHGVGKIVAIEEKSIGNRAEKPYYRVETDDIMLWVPVEEDDCLRMVTSPEDFAEALAVLERPSQQMSSTFQTRMARIRQARGKGTPRALARVLRDLWGRQKRRGQLSHTEKQALRDLIDQFLAEWSTSMGMEESQMSKKLFSKLRQNALTAANS